MACNGSWIASPGRYQDLAKSLCSADPRLMRQDVKATPWSGRPAKVYVVHLKESAECGKSMVFDTSEALQQHFNEQSHKASHGNRAIYILEGGNADFAAAIGSYFNLHPSMFAEYQCVSNVTAQSRGNEGLLASVWASRQCISMRYRELVVFPDRVDDMYGLRCPVTGRHVGSTRINGEFNKVGSAQRKCMRWASAKRPDNGWDYLLICDPPLRRVRKPAPSSNRIAEEIALPDSPFQGGYVDFIPEDIQVKCGVGPSRKSLAEDLLFYVSTHGNHLDMTYPTAIDIFLKKIVASHYLRQFDYERKNVMKVQQIMRRQSDFAHFDLSLVEAQWSDIQSMERRLSQHCLELEDTLIQLGIPLDPLDPSKVIDWRDTSADFQHLYQRFLYLRGWVERINSSITALASIVGNRQAFKEQQLSLQATERSRALTLIGLVFIPLAFTSSLFSMAEPYAPGDEKFWLYFAISLPMSVLVISLYHVLDLCYSADGSGWSLINFVNVLKERMAMK
ncbi:hypothetical protein EDB81DRAFT_669396 [Dactylonectria macrodidyma]|uniref:Uncharacterized protein n=1 Tax=Dactylonectria macrodidyma TaxID=307937 RepID=A0A9P9D732_9HYPO|nr:hypothetical protein EDB81DRAFT_669396 [Dactylonectria macrodidyma]